MLKRTLALFIVLAGLGLVRAQVVIPPSVIPANSVNTNDLGFTVKTVAVDWSGAGGSAWMNSVVNMELALGPVSTNTGPGGRPSAGWAIDPTTGSFATNCANFLGGKNPRIAAMLAEQGTTGSLVPADTNGFWLFDATNFTHAYINCDANGPPTINNGVFNSPTYPHNYFPGIPSDANPNLGNDYESIACSFMGYIYFSAGVTTLNVNSDDGFLLWMSPMANPYDARGLVELGEFNGGRGAGTTTMQVSVPQAGWYSVRLDFEQGGGGIECEFFSTDKSGNNVLVNQFNTVAAPVPTLDVLHGYQGTLEGSATWTASGGGHTGKAGDYAVDNTASASGDVLVPGASWVNNTTANDVMAVSLWVKRYDINNSSAFWFISPSSSSSERGFQAHTPWGDDNIYFDTSGCCDGSAERINASISGFGPYEAVGNDSWWNQWHFFVFSKNGPGDKEIWIDGQLFLKGSSSAPLPTDISEFYMAGGPAGSMDGLIDDFAVYSNALVTNGVASADVTNLFTGKITPDKVPGVMAYWNFNTPTNAGPAIVTAAPTALLAYPTPDTFPDAYPIALSPANGVQFAPDAPPASVSVTMQDGTMDQVAKVLAVRMNGVPMSGLSVSNTPSFTPNGHPLGNITWVNANTPQDLNFQINQTIPLEVDYLNTQGLTNSMVWSISTSGSNGVYRELWTNLDQALGGSLDSLTNSVYNPAWPGYPDAALTEVFPTFATPAGTGMQWYGQRLRAYLVPPTTGAYYFWIASADTGSLLLSTDETPGHAQLIAFNSSAVGPGQYTAQSTQKSAKITLTAGKRYYIEADMVQEADTDNLSVQWELPSGVIESPIPGNRMQIDYYPTIIGQPANTSVTEVTPATFTALVSNFQLPAFQWRQSGTNLPGQTGETLTLSNVPLTASGSTFDCVITNFLGSITSSVATLTVTRDTTPPVVVSAYDAGLSRIVVSFSKQIDPVSATTLANYSVSPNVAVLSAAMNDPQTVILTVGPLTAGVGYTITINGVRDLAGIPNVIAPNSQISFVASQFIPVSIGAPKPAGSNSPLPGGLAVSAGGADIGGTSDQFMFNYQSQTGNFDVSVCLQGLTDANSWAKAGLMARATLATNSPFAAVFATPSMAGSFFESRGAANSAASISGTFPVNYPNTWLRLKRASNLFTGYASFDGSNWVLLGSVSLTANPVYLGLAVTSHNTNAAATAEFVNYGPATSASVGNFTSPYEPLGPSSRRTQLTFSEIMYKPAPRTDGLNVEYLEIYNSNPWWDDISGYQLTGPIQYTFPSNTIIPAGGFLVVAAAPADLSKAYGGITNVVGPYTGSLASLGELQLLDKMGAIFLDTTYSSVLPWPAGANGTGHSIVLLRPSYGEADPRAWSISDVVGGSPGGPEAYRPGPLRNLVINEFLAHHDGATEGYVELYNHSVAAVDASGCVLTDDPSANKFILPAGTVIPAEGFVSFTESQIGFGLSPAGGLLLLKSPDGTRVEDAVNYEAQALNVSFGRSPDGASEFYALASNTPAASNGGILIGGIVINELMYKPVSGNDNDQYLELYNNGTNTVNLGGWKFTAGINYTIPAGTVIAPDGYLVVARSKNNLFSKYPNLNSGNTVGNYSGKLPHGGGRVALAMPQTLVVTNGDGSVSSSTIYPVEDEVTYKTGGKWGQWAHGGGSSLELINPNTDHRLAYNWADSDETQKSTWTNLSYTGPLAGGANYASTIDLIQLGLLGAGEALVDNVSVQAGTTGANLVVNPGLENGLTGWLAEGDHIRSSLETASGLGGYQSAQSLHLRSSDAVWTGNNSVEGTLSANKLASGQTATLALTGRWLRGTPEILLRLHGNWLELTGAFPIPGNLGTPGLSNSRAVTNAGPAIYDVKHSPAIPAAAQAVVVTARFDDQNAFQPALLYRIDAGLNANPTYKTVAMVDNGTGGDAIAGDGVYSATIPAQASGTVVAFLVQAVDTASRARTVFPQVLNDNSGLPRECVVVFGDPVPTTAFGHRHLWMTQNWANRWSKQGGLSNESNDGTLVDGSGRIIYNTGGRYAGSPYHQYGGSPLNNLGGYDWSLPEDDLLLGTSSFHKQHVPGNSTLDDATLQREQTSYWMARQIGMRWTYRKYYILYINGNRMSPLMEDSQVPDGDMINEYYPNDNNGFLYKNNAWFEFQPLVGSGAYNGGGLPPNNNQWCTLNKYTTTVGGVAGQPNLPRYRWNYWIRQFPDSANNFTNIYALINAANLPAAGNNYYTNMEALVDTEDYMRRSALEHATGDWDSYVFNNQWNMYSYKPLNGKFVLLKWDWNIDLGNSGSYGPGGGDLYDVEGADPVMAKFQSYPPYRRAMLRGFLDMANGPMNNANVNPVLDAKFAAFAAEGLNTTYGVAEPGADGLKSWIGTMHNSLLSAISAAGMANVAFTVSGSTNLVTGNNSVTLSGTAPLEVRTLTINGQQYLVSWSSLQGWTVTVPLGGLTNTISIQGLDYYGKPVPGTTASVTVTDTNAPQSYTYIPYVQPGMIYTQSFDSLPNPGAVTVNSANPVTIAGQAYSPANPFAFGAPAPAGGMGLPLTMFGWYGWAGAAAQFGASEGDQTTGGDISFGPTNALSGNRALGLLATSSSGSTAFGARFINASGVTLNSINLQYTGELWRQSTVAKTVQAGYYIDPTGTNSFSTNVTAWFPGLTVSFPTGAASPVDGTAPANQESLSAANLPIADWAPGAALWLVWDMADSAGKGQGLAIDNLSFSANPAPPSLTAQLTPNGLVVSWPSTFAGFTLQQNLDLSQPSGWNPVTIPVAPAGGFNTVTVPVSGAVQFFRLSQ